MESSLEQFQLTTDGACGVDRDQRVVFWTRAAEALLGFREPEVLGRPCYDVLCAQDEEGRPHCKLGCASFRRALRRNTVPTCNLRVRTKDAEELLLSVTTIQIAPRGGCRGAVLVHLLRDVSRYRVLEDSVAILRADLAASGRHAVSAPSSDCPQRNVTRRECEVLRHLAAGRSTAAIAEAMIVSPATVRNHIHNAFVKLDAHSRLEAVVVAARLGLLERAPRGRGV